MGSGQVLRVAYVEDLLGSPDDSSRATETEDNTSVDGGTSPRQGPLSTSSSSESSRSRTARPTRLGRPGNDRRRPGLRGIGAALGLSVHLERWPSWGAFCRKLHRQPACVRTQSAQHDEGRIETRRVAAGRCSTLAAWIGLLGFCGLARPAGRAFVPWVLALTFALNVCQGFSMYSPAGQSHITSLPGSGPYVAGRVAKWSLDSAHSAHATGPPVITPGLPALNMQHNVELCRAPVARGNDKRDPRPIPTPPRSCRYPRSVEVRTEELCVGPTLLEASCQEQHGYPFFLAATLLEVLLEHVDPSAKGDPTAHNSGPKPIAVSLAGALPTCRSFDLTSVSLDVAKTLDDVAPFLWTPWRLHSPLPPDLPWHSRTQAALQRHVPYEGEPVKELRVFTDGAYNGEVSSWAFAVIVVTERGHSPLGWARGVVALPSDPMHIGSHQHSALEGERSALFWAMAWILQAPFGVLLNVWSDCLVAAGQASGQMSSQEEAGTASACRAVTQAAIAAGKFHERQIGYVAAHAGHEYNELVDVLAKAHGLTDSRIPWPFASLPQWVEDGSLSWMWIIFETLHRPSAWPTLRGSCLVDEARNACPLPSAHRRYLSLEPEPMQRSAAQSTQTADVRLRLVTVNVQTLEEDRTKGWLGLGRVPYIRSQLNECQANVIGLQETRAKATETVTSTSHYRFISAGDGQGNLGVELWFSRLEPFACQGSHQLVFALPDFRVLSWLPRHLAVRVVRGALKLLFVVCHAPTATDLNRHRWWQQFADKIISLAAKDQVVLLGDFNVRFCAPVPHRIGEVCWEHSGEPPEHVYRLLNLLDLWIPSTFRILPPRPVAYLVVSRTWDDLANRLRLHTQ